MDGEKCLNEECRRAPETRGLCGTCYKIARDLVRAKKTTWEELESEKLALPTKKRPSTAREWILGSLKKKKTKKGT